MTTLDLAAGFDARAARDAAGQRLAAFLAGDPAKVLARRHAASPDTAKKWKQGVWPDSRALVSMIDAYGAPFLDHVVGPLLEAEVSLDGRLERVAREIDAAREELARARRESAPTGRAGVGQNGAAGGASAVLGGRAADGRGPGRVASRSLVRRAGAALALSLALVIGAETVAPDIAAALGIDPPDGHEMVALRGGGRGGARPGARTGGRGGTRGGESRTGHAPTRAAPTGAGARAQGPRTKS